MTKNGSPAYWVSSRPLRSKTLRTPVQEADRFSRGFVPPWAITESRIELTSCWSNRENIFCKTKQNTRQQHKPNTTDRRSMEFKHCIHLLHITVCVIHSQKHVQNGDNRSSETAARNGRFSSPKKNRGHCTSRNASSFNTYYIQAYVHIKTNKLGKFTDQNTASHDMHTSNRSECKIRVNTTVSIAVFYQEQRSLRAHNTPATNNEPL